MYTVQCTHLTLQTVSQHENTLRLIRKLRLILSNGNAIPRSNDNFVPLKPFVRLHTLSWTIQLPENWRRRRWVMRSNHESVIVSIEKSKSKQSLSEKHQLPFTCHAEEVIRIARKICIMPFNKSIAELIKHRLCGYQTHSICFLVNPTNAMWHNHRCKSAHNICSNTRNQTNFTD